MLLLHVYFHKQEIIGSQGVTISINPQDKLPTVSIECSKNIHLYYYEPHAFGSVFTVDCSDVMVHFQPPHVDEYRLELPPDDKLNQFVSELRGSRMSVAQVIRGMFVCICTYCVLGHGFVARMYRIGIGIIRVCYCVLTACTILLPH